MRNPLPTRTLMFLGAMYAALTLGAAAAQAAPARHSVSWAQTALPGIVDGEPRSDQVLLTGSKRHSCQSLHVTFEAGGLAQSAALLLRRQGRPDVVVQTQSDTTGRLNAALRPGRSWRLAASTPSVSISVDMKATASCLGRRGVSTR